MVAINNIEDKNNQNSKTLGDWVKNFRLKKIQMKRKLRSSGENLRICAILSSALVTAELELRRKQQERFQKWLEFQTKINKNKELLQPKCELRHSISMRRHPQSEEELVLLTDECDEKSCKESEAINNLWKCELSDLDNFMRSISGSTSKKFEKSISNIIGQRDTFPKKIQTRSIRVSS